ncbi:hypothetical protein AU476_09610 [Cupriavidus sp. UYMSc13B]|nr:hypothetical protein AU476_09610 [Cupriavidus sp. UYMSc13B]
MAEQLVDYFAQSGRLQMTLRKQICSEVQATLQHFISEPEFLQRLAEAFADGGAYADLPIRVSIPSHAQRIVPVVRKGFARSYRAVEVSCCDIDAFTIEWGEEIVKFNSYDVARRLSMSALASCAGVADIIDHKVLVRKVLADALRRLEPALPPLREDNAMPARMDGHSESLEPV